MGAWKNRRCHVARLGRIRCGKGIVKSAKIILLCMASAIVYGNCHDQVTARVCVEYFTVGHVPPFASESPTVLAFFFGTMATWWVGLIFGVLLASVARAGSWRKFEAGDLFRPIGCLLTVMAVVSIVAGMTGYELGRASGFVLPEPLGVRVPADRHHLFFADTLAHVASYLVGILGGVILCAGVLLRRYRIARATDSTDDGAVPLDLLGERWLVATSRWSARAVSIPLFVLLTLLTLGDGVPNPLVASPRERLFVTIALVMLFGVILAWKWEGVGSLLILGGLVLFVAADEAYLVKIVFVPWVVTGLLYLGCWVGGGRGGVASSTANKQKVSGNLS